MIRLYWELGDGYICTNYQMVTGTYTEEDSLYASDAAPRNSQGSLMTMCMVAPEWKADGMPW